MKSHKIAIESPPKKAYKVPRVNLLDESSLTAEKRPEAMLWPRMPENCARGRQFVNVKMDSETQINQLDQTFLELNDLLRAD